MASNEADDDDDDETLDPFLISSLGFGLGLLFVTRSRTLKPLSTAIKLAYGAVQIPKALGILRSPSSPQNLFVASKALIKGFKASSRLIPVKSNPASSSVLFRRLKAYVATFNLIRYHELLESGFVRGGYKISKNFIKVVEGFVGFQLNSAVKQGVDALGLFFKASSVAREVAKYRRRRSRVGFGRRVHRRRLVIFSRSERLGFDGRRGLKGSTLRKRGMVPAKDFEVSLSDLLCLSIPICEAIPSQNYNHDSVVVLL